MTLLFVYGTLRKGQYNHYLLDKADYIAEAIIAGYRMVSLGSYPAIYQTGNDDDIVKGELYDVDDNTLQDIDTMEMSAGYTLLTISSCNIRLYVFDKEKARKYKIVSSGDWVNQDSLANTK